MGASVTKTSVDIVNESIVEAIMETASSSVAQVTGKQKVTISGTMEGSEITQKAILNLKSLQDVQVDNELIAKMEETIRQQAEANSVLLTASVADSSTKMQNILKAGVTSKIIQESTAGIDLDQEVEITKGGIMKNSKISQDLQLFSENMQRALNKNRVAQSIVADVDQKATSTTSWGLDFWVWIVVAIAFIILVIIAGMVIYFKSGSKKETETIEPPPEPRAVLEESPITEETSA